MYGSYPYQSDLLFSYDTYVDVYYGMALVLVSFIRRLYIKEENE